MEIIILPTYKEVNDEVTHRVVTAAKEKPDMVLGFATGRTMLGIYRNLIKAYQQGQISFAQLTSFNLDEYIGFSPEDPISFHAYMQKNLFNHIDIKPENVFIPSSQPQDIEIECQQYESLIKAKGGIDLQLLGIGREGHIGYNEPSSSLQARTRVKTLTDVTLRDNFGVKEGPRFAITMGIGTIMDAKEIILVALGEEKTKVIAPTVEGPVTASCPASALQFHPKAKIILDEEAAALLQRRNYYEWVWEHKHDAEKMGN